MGEVPRDLVVVGRILDAWGIRGGVKVMPYAENGSALLEVKQWWSQRDGRWDSLEVLSAKTHGEVLTATLMGFATRSAAEGLKGAEISIARSRFPVTEDGEFYWVDLIGLEVVNLEGASLGHVASMMETGAHAILDVRRHVPADDGSGNAKAGSGKAIGSLIPFVARYVKAVELAKSRVVVDWGPDYEE